MVDAAAFRHNPDYSAVPPDLSYVSTGDVRAAYEQGHNQAQQEAAQRIAELEETVQLLGRKLDASQTDRSELRFKNRRLREQSVGQTAVSEALHG